MSRLQLTLIICSSKASPGGAYSYEEFSTLNDVSFSDKHDKISSVIGPNGCDKSTYLKDMGFQPKLYTKDNIYIYGIIMWFTGRGAYER